VPIALATSLAPIPNAMKKPANAAIIRIKVGSRNSVSIVIYVSNFIWTYLSFNL
jgi:hypothetical protein